MAYSPAYERQVALLIRTLPFVAEETDFALKGGTAINLFVRDLPRLSVDIDLTYLPVHDRPGSLAQIDAAMKRIAERIRASIKGVHVALSLLHGEGIVTKLVVRLDGTQIKIEVTPVTRGVVFPVELTPVSAGVEARFGFAETTMVSFADLYAGKLVAALDRQHPRDLFDVRDLIANEGIGDDLRRAFAVYMASHDRPLAEVLAPHRKPLEEEFERGFVGMTLEPVALDELVATREQLIDELVGAMPLDHRRFLLGFKAGTPVWSLIGLEAAADLPAIRWKQRNLDRLQPERRKAMVVNLAKVLKLDPAEFQ